MRKRALIAIVAIVSLAFAGVLLAAPKASHVDQHAFATGGIDIFGITGAARDLPHQSYPAH